MLNNMKKCFIVLLSFSFVLCHAQEEVLHSAELSLAPEPTFVEAVKIETGIQEKMGMEAEPVIKLSPNKPKDYFIYLGAGGAGFVYPIFPEGMIGFRKTESHHVWDLNLGGSPWLKYAFGQTSYLYFPKKSSGLYLGIGLTVSWLPRLSDMIGGYTENRMFVNLPFTIGHQFTSGKAHQFLQFQLTPIMTTSLSYGFGF